MNLFWWIIVLFVTDWAQFWMSRCRLQAIRCAHDSNLLLWMNSRYLYEKFGQNLFCRRIFIFLPWTPDAESWMLPKLSSWNHHSIPAIIEKSVPVDLVEKNYAWRGFFCLFKQHFDLFLAFALKWIAHWTDCNELGGTFTLTKPSTQ